jgi:hypothetical protein
LPSGTDRTQQDPLTEAVDLEPDRKREILAREALLGRDDWTVLGLKPGANAEAVKLAYFEASRVFHPDRYYGKNLGSFRARLERIFQRLSEAHETLTEALRRAPPPPAAGSTHAVTRPGQTGSTAPVDPRAEERRARLARHPYLARNARASALVEEAQRQMKSAPQKALHLLGQAKTLGGHSPKDRAAMEAEAKQQVAKGRADDEMKAGPRSWSLSGRTRRTRRPAGCSGPRTPSPRLASLPSKPSRSVWTTSSPSCSWRRSASGWGWARWHADIWRRL